jgi:hypothetical protein
MILSASSALDTLLGFVLSYGTLEFGPLGSRSFLGEVPMARIPNTPVLAHLVLICRLPLFSCHGWSGGNRTPKVLRSQFWRLLPSPMGCRPADGAGVEPAGPLSGAGELATHSHKPLGHPSEESIARAGAMGRVIGPSYVPTLNPEHAQGKCSPCVPMGGCVNFASNRPQPTTPIKEGHARTSNPNSQENGRIA